MKKSADKGRTIKLTLLLIIALLIAGALVVRGINSRVKAAAIVKQETLDLAVPTVSVIHPKRGAMKDEVVLPGNIQAFTDAPIYARANGYLKRWYADIGAHVKAGQLLADVDTPEIDKQLDQARADLATAEANLKLAEITATRYEALWKLDSVAKQDRDEKVSAYEAGKTMVASARANVKRLEDMVSFQKVFAPFEGVITARNTDVGALINAGNGGLAQELFHLAATTKLRVFVSVPQVYSRAAVPGVIAELTLTEYPGRHFTGKVVRTSEAIDTATRTLLTEVDVDNASGQLLPGAFAEVHLKLPSKATTLLLPVTALIFRSEGLQVAVVRDDSKAELVPIMLGRDFGTEVEVVSGITAQDAVIVNPPDSLTSGATVHVAGQP